MDMALESWISELEVDDYFIDMESTNLSSEFDGCVQIASLQNSRQHSSSPESKSAGHMKDHKVDIYRTRFEMTPKATVSTDQENEKTEGSDPKDEKDNPPPKVLEIRSNAMTRTPAETHHRVMAERKRREKLSQQFIALSAMIPGLKKMDKSSVLGDAIEYIKQLEENVKTLEEKLINKESSQESMVFVKKSKICSDDDTSSCDGNIDGHLIKKSLPEIEARISEKFVLIRIHCEKQKGFALRVLKEIENLSLTVVNSSFLPFGKHAVDITVVAQMEARFSMTVKMLVKNLSQRLLIS